MGRGAVGLVGRRAELARLRAAWAAARPGEGRLVALAGEPGIGKTRLAQALLAEAAQDEAIALNGRAYDSPGQPAYGVVRAALRSARRSATAVELAQASQAAGPDLGRLESELLAARPPEPAVTPADESRLFAATTTFLGALARSRPLCLLLDDLQWADPAALELLAHLVRALAEAPVLVLATYRDDELISAHPWSVLLAELRREGLADQIRLRPLADSEVVTLARQRADGSLPDSALAAIVRASDGNPFFVEELVAELEEAGEPGAGGLAVPAGVRALLARRLTRLDPLARQVLAAVATIGSSAALGRLVAVCDLDESALAGALAGAVRGGLLREQGPPEAPRYAFPHDLVRQAIAAELVGPERLRWHLRVADALERMPPDGSGGERVGALADHLALAGHLAAPERLRSHAQAAAAAASAVFAHAEALRYARLAAQAAERTGDAALHRAALRDLADAALRAGELEPWAEQYASHDMAPCPRLVARVLANAAVCLDPPGRAEQLFRQAAELAAALRAGPEAAQTAHDHGRWLLARGEAGRGQPLLDRAQALWASLGEAVAPAPPPSPRAVELTPREREVLRLVAQGRSNREIAAALHVSGKTVATHLEHIYRKLGVDTRAAASVYAVKAGLA